MPKKKELHLTGILTELHYITFTDCPDGWHHQPFLWAILNQAGADPAPVFAPTTLDLDTLRQRQYIKSRSGYYFKIDGEIKAITLPWISLSMIQDGQSIKVVKQFAAGKE